MLETTIIVNPRNRVYWPGVTELRNDSNEPIVAIRVGNEYRFEKLGGEDE